MNSHTGSLMEEWSELLKNHRPLPVRDLPLPEKMRLAVVAPHPDDFDAIGVTMRYFQEHGHRIDVGVCTSGASGVEDGFQGAITLDAKASLREDEQRSSCRFFGLSDEQLVFLRLVEGVDGHPVDSNDNLNLVQSFLLSLHPDIVFLPHGNDSNLGHQRIYKFFQHTVQEAKLTLVACLNRDPKTISIREDLITAFGKDLATWKAGLLRFHRSQHQRNLNTRGYGFDMRILMSNRQIGLQKGQLGEYAETFELQRYQSGILLNPE